MTTTMKKEKEIRELLLKAIQNGQQALTEYDSKRVVAAANVPVTRELLVHSRQEAMDQDVLVHALVCIGNLGMAHEDIAEIDINPLIVTEGKPAAVDALVILKTNQA